MRIFVDENIPLVSVVQLREMGHDVLDIRGTNDEGMSDDQLWTKVCQEERLLITTDKGFAFRRHIKHYGILIVSLRQPNHLKIHQRIMEAMGLFTPEQWLDLLVIMRDMTMSSWQKHK